MNNFSSLLHYISEWVLQLQITFCMAPSFLQQFIYTTKDVICWTSNRPAWSKIEGRLQISKCWNLLIRTARWVVSQTRVLQRSNTQKHFHRTFIKSVHVGRLFIGCRNRPTLLQSIFSSCFSLRSCKTTLKTHTPSSCQAPSSPSDLWTCYVCVSIHSSAFFLMGS